MTLSLSTMWAQQDRFVADMHLFVDETLALGYDAIEISHLTPTAPFERLLGRHGVVISSIHAPAPLTRDAGDRANSSLNLAAIDDEERHDAIEFTKRSIDYAEQVGARFVVVHLGAVGNKMFDDELQLRRLYDSGTRAGERVEQLREAIIRRRHDEYEPWLEAARDTISKLCAYAQRRDNPVAIGIENRLHYHEIPQPDEAYELIDDFPADVVGYWHDVGHAEVQARLGLVDKRRWLDVNGARTLGSHLHDVDGIGDHRAPGHGDVEWDYIRDGLPPTALRVFEINQHQAPDAVAGAIPFLRERGVIA